MVSKRKINQLVVEPYDFTEKYLSKQVESMFEDELRRVMTKVLFMEGRCEPCSRGRSGAEPKKIDNWKYEEETVRSCVGFRNNKETYDITFRRTLCPFCGYKHKEEEISREFVSDGWLSEKGARVSKELEEGTYGYKPGRKL